MKKMLLCIGLVMVLGLGGCAHPYVTQEQLATEQFETQKRMNEDFIEMKILASRLERLENRFEQCKSSNEGEVYLMNKLIESLIGELKKWQMAYVRLLGEKQQEK